MSPLTLSSSNNATNISGAVYAPMGNVTGADGGDFSLGQLVAQDLTCPSYGLVTIG